jgi:rhamnosyltransferase
MPSVGALCPTVVNKTYPEMRHYPYCWVDGEFRPVVPASEADDMIAIDSTVSSGTLYQVEALTAVNGFCEKYFIDFVDHECHLRFRQAGFGLFWVLPARIYHCLGQRQVMTSSGLWIEHPPYRYYYMVRNMLEGTYRLGGVRASAKFGIQALTHSVRILRYGQAPWISLGYMLKGLLHAVLGRFGTLDSL